MRAILAGKGAPDLNSTTGERVHKSFAGVIRCQAGLPWTVRDPHRVRCLGWIGWHCRAAHFCPVPPSCPSRPLPNLRSGPRRARPKSHAPDPGPKKNRTVPPIRSLSGDRKAICRTICARPKEATGDGSHAYCASEDRAAHHMPATLWRPTGGCCADRASSQSHGCARAGCPLQPLGRPLTSAEPGMIP